jgi:hypothetical protein
MPDKKAAGSVARPDEKIKIGDASDPRVGVIIAPSAF